MLGHVLVPLGVDSGVLGNCSIEVELGIEVLVLIPARKGKPIARLRRKLSRSLPILYRSILTNVTIKLIGHGPRLSRSLLPVSFELDVFGHRIVKVVCLTIKGPANKLKARANRLHSRLRNLAQALNRLRLGSRVSAISIEGYLVALGRPLGINHNEAAVIVGVDLGKVEGRCVRLIRVPARELVALARELNIRLLDCCRAAVHKLELSRRHILPAASTLALWRHKERKAVLIIVVTLAVSSSNRRVLREGGIPANLCAVCGVPAAKQIVFLRCSRHLGRNGHRTIRAGGGSHAC